MTNFEYLKSLESEYKMADTITYFISTNLSDIIQKDGEIKGLPLLRWLQSERPIE